MTVLDAPSTTDQYAQAVREACADLPPTTRDELLEDLDEHLADVAAELADGETLVGRLGTAQAYAADLRQSAGYPAAATERRTGFGQGAVATRIRSWWDRSEAHPQGRAIRDYLDDLRPAWWLARAYLVVAIGAMITADDGFTIIPHLFGSSAAGLVAVLALGWWSVRLGRATQPGSADEVDDRRRRRAVACNVIAGLCLLVVLARFDDRPVEYPPVDSTDAAPAPGFLTSAEGDPIKNIYAFAADGTALDGVLLYDDRGRPIDAVTVWDDLGNEMVPRFPLTEDGTEVRNQYPTAFEVTGPDGLPAPGPSRPNLAVPVLEEAPAATTTTRPAATTTAPPSTTEAPTTTVPAKPGG